MLVEALRVVSGLPTVKFHILTEFSLYSVLSQLKNSTFCDLCSLCYLSEKYRMFSLIFAVKRKLILLYLTQFYK